MHGIAPHNALPETEPDLAGLGVRIESEVYANRRIALRGHGAWSAIERAAGTYLFRTYDDLRAFTRGNPLQCSPSEYKRRGADVNTKVNLPSLGGYSRYIARELTFMLSAGLGGYR